MRATTKNITSKQPAHQTGKTVGCYLSATEFGQDIREEGGLRTKGQYKASLPGKPLVTVLTVCLNSEATIAQAIQSVFDQDYDNIEYLLVDGLSKDNTVDIIRNHADAIDYYVSAKDSGLYNAMNRGLQLATGEYVVMLNSDDWYTSDAISSLVQATRYSGSRMASALAKYIDPNGQRETVLRSMPFDASVRLRMPLRHETMLVPASVYEEVGEYDESYGIIADLDWTMRAFDLGVSHYEIPRPLLNFRTTGISNVDKESLFAERRRLLAKRFPVLSVDDVNQLGELAKLTPEAVANLAHEYQEERDFVQSLEAFHRDQRLHTKAKKWQRMQIDWHELGRRPDDPLISIILPIYNANATLANCIGSLICQSFDDFEVICIDDASPEDPSEVINTYREADPRITFLRNDTNIGLGATRNRGVRCARGRYVFHVDPDDTVPSDALQLLIQAAEANDADMVKGAFYHEQLLFGQSHGERSRKSLLAEGASVAGTSLKDMPTLLRNTEGHWSYLYRREFALSTPYPVDLKMGQDSIFLVSALIRAERISLIDEVVYNYRANADSAMNTFNFRKYMDALEWRRRAWHLLFDAQLQFIGNRLLQAYWGVAFFENLARDTDEDHWIVFANKFRAAFREAGVKTLNFEPPGRLKRLFTLLLAGKDRQAREFISSTIDDKSPKSGRAPDKEKARISGTSGASLRVATISSTDHGGAGTGTQRRVAALRQRGVDAWIFSLLVKSEHPYVERWVPRLENVNTRRQDDVWKAVRERAILPVKALPGYKAQELFSLPESVVDFRDLAERLQSFDILHLHWVVGMFDYDNTEVLADKPLVWTFADMNAFTGGCHYSEGCDEYKRQCRRCPLLGGDSNMAHKAWKKKKQAYDRLKNLQIICPSQWLAERAAESSLLEGRAIHHIPNAFPAQELRLTNKVVARHRLGLPQNRKLVLFGAESVGNRRKGGDLLRRAFREAIEEKEANIGVILFGRNTLKLPVETFPFGFINDNELLSLVYAAADVYLFPSREDNAPLTVGESMLSGTPVVCFSIGNIPELVKHKQTGYIAKPHDVSDFAVGIRWALDADPEEAIFRGAKCRLAAASYHDPDTAVTRHLAVYESALSQASRE